MRPRPGDAGGEGADHQDAVQQAHLAGAVQEQGQRPQLQRDPQAAADGAAAPRGDSGSARSVSHARHFNHAVSLYVNHRCQILARRCYTARALRCSAGYFGTSVRTGHN